MEPAAAVAAAPPQPLPAAIEPAGPAPAQDAGLAVTPPSFDIDFETATTTIGTLPSLHPRPSHANIRSLERVLFERLETLQSAQSEEWGFRGLAEQPAEYALKSATPWVNAPNPGPHRPIGLNAQATRDAEAIYDSEKAAWQAQATVTRAINAALNVAVPKAFRRNSTPAGGTIIGTSVYRSNHDPRDILLALRTVYGTPSPAERNSNEALFATPWNPAEPIETYFDRLEDCYVAAIIASPPYTIAQMITKAIMAIQLTGLYSQALIEWHALPAVAKTWDTLKTHFTTAYIVREQSGTGTMAMAGYHSAANTIDHDDVYTNIEATISAELAALQLANNMQQSANSTAMAELRAALAATQQQLANFTAAPLNYLVPPTRPPTYTPNVPRLSQQHSSRNRSYHHGRTLHHQPGNRTFPVTPTTMPAPGIPAPLLFPQTPTHTLPRPGTTPPSATVPGSTNGRPTMPPNPNKRFNNLNYCYSCGFDVPVWHTSTTCPMPNAHHQAGCTRDNVAQYAAAGHHISRRAMHKNVMPINPPPHCA